MNFQKNMSAIYFLLSNFLISQILTLITSESMQNLEKFDLQILFFR